MTRKAWLLVGSIVAASALLLAINVRSPQAAYQPDGQVVRWEYKLVSITEGLRVFNRLGADGWELGAAMGAGQPDGVLIFKRPLP